MPYTFDAETIYELADDINFEFTVGQGSTLKTVDKDYLKAMKGHDSHHPQSQPF